MQSEGMNVGKMKDETGGNTSGLQFGKCCYSSHLWCHTPAFYPSDPSTVWLSIP